VDSAIEVFSDVWCPFAYVGIRRVVAERDRAGAGAVLSFRAWPLELVNGAPLPADLVVEEAHTLRAQVAPELFAGIGVDHFPSSTIGALGLSAWAADADPVVGEQVALELRSSLFERGEDIGDHAVLERIAAAHGLSLPGPPWMLDRVTADLEEGRRRGVRGSPHFFVRTEDYFCPTLRLSHEGGLLHAGVDVDGLTAFLARAF
jgi:predicted DsbA family dithiol-disulfide isomerase